MNLLDALPHLTSRIEAYDAAGRQSIGTGFFFGFRIDNDNSFIALITNKHVLHGAKNAIINVSRMKDGQPSFGEYNKWTIEGVDKNIVGHPDPAIDIAGFPVGSILNQMVDAGQPPFFQHLQAENIPSDKAIQSLSAVEDILMIGYPTGVWDSTHNIPIIRRGITATPYARDYEGRPEFMIDCACFPGSSGSPVIIASQGSYPMKDGGIAMGTRLFLLGLLWGGPQYTAEGEIVARPAPTSVVPVSISRIPTNLGFCLKAHLILDLFPLFKIKYHLR